MTTRLRLDDLAEAMLLAEMLREVLKRPESMPRLHPAELDIVRRLSERADAIEQRMMRSGVPG